MARVAPCRLLLGLVNQPLPIRRGVQCGYRARCVKNDRAFSFLLTSFSKKFLLLPHSLEHLIQEEKRFHSGSVLLDCSDIQSDGTQDLGFATLEEFLCFSFTHLLHRDLLSMLIFSIFRIANKHHSLITFRHFYLTSPSHYASGGTDETTS